MEKFRKEGGPQLNTRLDMAKQHKRWEGLNDETRYVIMPNSNILCVLAQHPNSYCKL